MARTYFITGTDTGVGKTVLTALWTRYLLQRGIQARAVKPFCSGGRSDARWLRTAQGGSLSLEAINPWSFRAPLAPQIAAQKAGLRVTLAPVLTFLRRARRQCDVLLVEGAGGLLSPLGEEFSNRELMAGLRALPVVVCPNRLGAINQVLLVLSALPKTAADRARVVMVQTSRPDHSAASNLEWLGQCLGRVRVLEMPWLGSSPHVMKTQLTNSLCHLFDSLSSFRCPLTAGLG